MKYLKHSNEYEALRGLFFHQWNVSFKGSIANFAYYADKLDRLGVPWSVQNAIANAARTRKTAFSRQFSQIINEVTS